MLTAYGAGINLYNDNGDTPLLLAARLSQPAVAKILLSKGKLSQPTSLFSPVLRYLSP